MYPVEYVAFIFNIVAKFICVTGKCILNVTNVNLFCNAWVCECVGFVTYGDLVTCVLVFTMFFCIVSFMYIYSYLFCLY